MGFYSNVDRSFAPASARHNNDCVSIYVERAYVGGEKPSEQEIADYGAAVVKELQDWQYIRKAEVVDPTWIDVAYTWAYPGSRWKQEAIQQLEAHQIYPIGRYGRWIFQGIADSIRDGFFAGSSFKSMSTIESCTFADSVAHRQPAHVNSGASKHGVASTRLRVGTPTNGAD